jgi:hypothetical protein
MYVTNFTYNRINKNYPPREEMHTSLESITYLVKREQTVLIDNKECCYDEIIAQCTDFDKAVALADTTNAKIEKHTQPLNNVYEEPLEHYSSQLEH